MRAVADGRCPGFAGFRDSEDISGIAGIHQREGIGHGRVDLARLAGGIGRVLNACHYPIPLVAVKEQQHGHPCQALFNAEIDDVVPRVVADHVQQI